MARGNLTSPPAASSLPKVDYEIINDDKLKLPGGTDDRQARTFGYNDYQDFVRPDHYIRHIEPLESDLATTVEYDMDEQDQEWLDTANVDRKKAQMDIVSCESFEIIMDRLEKEWFDLTKNIPKPDFAMPSEDSTCAICDDSEGENSNAIVFCDGCNLAVHQDCYGVPYIPEGQWLCRKCTVSPEVPVDCYLCPNEGGAFKQTVGGEWVHLLCAIWIPETRVANEVFMEPVTGVERISKQRWKLRCSICDTRAGACIQCTKPSCFVAFHATCARKEKLLMPMKSVQGAEPASLTCFCDRHLPQEQQDARAAALELDASREPTAPASQLMTKSARAYAKTYKPGPPLVPAIIVGRIVDYIYRIKIRKKQEFVQQMSRYWSLKREARRGAPLLKRLHLEPWTANAGTKVQSQEEKLMRLDQLMRLRQDLINVRGLTDLLRKRETRKLRQTEIIYEVLAQGLFPHYATLRLALERIMAFDRQDHFKMPVSKHDVPDYYDIIKKPMCWSYIDTKLDQHQYWDLQLFLDDIDLVINNALLYNKSGTTFHKLALRIQRESRTILSGLQTLKFVHEEIPTRSSVEEGDEASDVHTLEPLGNLEPPLDILKLFMSSEAIRQDLNMELDGDPASTLFNYEFAKVKPPPPLSPEGPPPPPAPRPKKGRPKRDRKAEAERARANKQAKAAAVRESEVSQKNEEGEQQDLVHQKIDEERREEKERDRSLQAELDASAGFRAPRTRKAIAASAAFEAEAHGSVTAAASTSAHVLLAEPAEPEVTEPIEPLVTESAATELTTVESASAGPSRPPDSVSDSGKPRSKKRLSLAVSGQTSIPQVVQDVGSRDSFIYFDRGWILAEDQKRGGRVATERSALPPPKKRQKTDQGPSRLSIVSTAPSDNYTLRKTPPLTSDPHEMKHNPNANDDGAMDVDVPGDRSFDSQRFEHLGGASRPASPSFDDGIDEPHNIVTQPNGVVIIEKLDTPATRREKNIRRKAEKQRQAALANEGNAMTISAESSNPSAKRATSAPMEEAVVLTAATTMEQVETSHMIDPVAMIVSDDNSNLQAQTTVSDICSPIPVAPIFHPSPRQSEEVRETQQEDGFDESELSELSSESEESRNGGLKSDKPEHLNQDQASISPPPQRKRGRPRKPQKPEAYDDGTIVWAKSDSFPWWPAVIHADSSKQVPRNILESHKEKRIKKKQKLYIVQYYDKQSSWQSVPRDKLQLLGEDTKLDEEMLSSNQKQKWKPSASKQQCREAYRTALAEMDVDGSSLHAEPAQDGGEDADGESES